MFQMKIGIITDTHWGYFSSQITRRFRKKERLINAERQMLNEAISWWKENDIDIIIHLGDTVDSPVVEQTSLAILYFQQLTAAFNKVIVIRGNHDPKPQSQYWIALKSIGVDVVTEPKTYGNIGLIPHIPGVDNKQLRKIVKEMASDVEIIGLHYFYDTIGNVVDVKLTDDIKREYPNIQFLFGHIHTTHDDDNVHIVGSFMRRSFSPAADLVAIWDGNRLIRHNMSHIRKKMYYFDGEKGLGKHIKKETVQFKMANKNIDVSQQDYLQYGFVPGFKRFLKDIGEDESYAKDLEYFINRL